MALKPITAATALAVSLAEVKAQANIDVSDDDTKITAIIHSATALAEQATGRAIMTQTWELTLDSFPNAIELTRVPVQSVTSITYADSTGAETVLSEALYSLDNADYFGFAYVVPAYNTDWPDTRDEINAVKVRYVAGYANAASVPAATKQWICLVVGMLYENHGILSERQMHELEYAKSLLDGMKVFG